jgi:hypothetical protein
MNSLRDFAKALAELKGRQTIESIADHFHARGYLDVPPDLDRQWMHNRTRSIIGKVRKFEDPDVPGQKIEWVNIPGSPGETQRYFKCIHELTVDEAVQFCTEWHQRAATAQAELRHYIALFTSVHGDTFQTLLPFDVPRVKKGQHR